MSQEHNKDNKFLLNEHDEIRELNKDTNFHSAQPNFLDDYFQSTEAMIQVNKENFVNGDVLNLTSYTKISDKLIVNLLINQIKTNQELAKVTKFKAMIMINNIETIIHVFKVKFPESEEYVIPCGKNDSGLTDLIGNNSITQFYLKVDKIDETITTKSNEDHMKSIMDEIANVINNETNVNDQLQADYLMNKELKLNDKLQDIQLDKELLDKISSKDDDNKGIFPNHLNSTVNSDNESLESCKLETEQLLNETNVVENNNKEFIHQQEFDQIAFLDNDIPHDLNHMNKSVNITVVDDYLPYGWEEGNSMKLIKIVKDELPYINDDKVVLIMNSQDGESTILKTVTEDILNNRINFIQSALDSEELPNLAEYLITGDVRGDVKISLGNSQHITHLELTSNPEKRVNITSPDLIIYRHISKAKWLNLGLNGDNYTTGELIAVADIATTLALRTNRFGFESKLLKMDSYKYKVLCYFLGQLFNCTNILCPIIVTSSMSTVKSHMKDRKGFSIKFSYLGQEIEQTIPVVFNIFGDLFIKLCEENIIKLYSTGFQFKFHTKHSCLMCKKQLDNSINYYYNMGDLCENHYYYKYINSNPEFNPKPLTSDQYHHLVSIFRSRKNSNLPSIMKFMCGFPSNPQLKPGKISYALNKLWLISRDLNKMAINSIFSVQEISINNDSIVGVDYLGNFLAPQHGQLNKWKLLLLFSFIDYALDQPLQNIMELSNYEYYSTSNSNIGFRFKYEPSILTFDMLNKLQFKRLFQTYNQFRDFKLINHDPISDNDLIWLQCKPNSESKIAQRSLYNNFLPLNLIFLSDIPVEICIRHNLAIFYNNLTKGLINFDILNGIIVILQPNHIMNQPIHTIDKPIQLFEKGSTIDKLWKTNYQKQGIPRYHPEVYLCNIDENLTDEEIYSIKTFLKSVKVLNEKEFTIKEDLKMSYYSDAHLAWKSLKEKLSVDQSIRIKHEDLMWFFNYIIENGFDLNEHVSHRIMSWCKCRKLLKQMEFIISEDGDLVSRNSDDSLSFSIITKEGFMFTINEVFLLQYHSFFHKYNQLKINYDDLLNKSSTKISKLNKLDSLNPLDDAIIKLHDDVIYLSTMTDHDSSQSLLNALISDQEKKKSLLVLLNQFKIMRTAWISHQASSKLINFQRLILVLTTCSGKLRDFFIPLTLIRNQFPKQLVHSLNYPASSFEKYPSLDNGSFFSKLVSLIVYRSAFMDTLKQLIIINSSWFIANLSGNSDLSFVLDLFPAKKDHPLSIKYKAGLKINSQYPYADLFLDSFVDFRYKIIEYSTIGLMLRTQDPITENKTKAADLDDSDSTYSLVEKENHNIDVLVSSLHPDSNLALRDQLSQLRNRVKSSVNISNNFIINPLSEIRDTNVAGAPFPRLKIGSLRLDLFTLNQCNAISNIRTGSQHDMIGLIKMIKVPIKVINDIIPMITILMGINLEEEKYDELYCVFAWNIIKTNQLRGNYTRKNNLSLFYNNWNKIASQFSWVLNPLNEDLNLDNLFNSSSQPSILSSTDDLKRILTVSELSDDVHETINSLSLQHVLSGLYNSEIRRLLNCDLNRLIQITDYKFPPILLDRIRRLKWFELKNLNELLILVGLRNMSQRKFMKAMCIDVPRFSNAIADQFFGINNGADLRSESYWKLSEWLDFSVTIGYFPKEEIKDRGITTANVFLRIVLTNIELFADSVSRLIPNDLSSKIDDKKQVDSYMNCKIRKKKLHPLFDELYFDKPSNSLPLNIMKNIDSKINIIPLMSIDYSEEVINNLDGWYRTEIELMQGEGLRDKISNVLSYQLKCFSKVIRGKKLNFKAGYLCQLAKTNIFLIKSNLVSLELNKIQMFEITINQVQYYIIKVVNFNESIGNIMPLTKDTILNNVTTTIIKNTLILNSMSGSFILNASELNKLRKKYDSSWINLTKLIKFNEEDKKDYQLNGSKEYLNWKKSFNSCDLSSNLETNQDDLINSKCPLNIKFANFLVNLFKNKLVTEVDLNNDIVKYVDYSKLQLSNDVNDILDQIKPYPCCQDPFNIDYLGKGFLWFNPTDKPVFKIRPSASQEKLINNNLSSTLLNSHTREQTSSKLKECDIPFEVNDIVFVSSLLDFYDNAVLMSRALSATKMSKLNQLLNFSYRPLERMEIFSNIILSLRTSKNKIKTNQFMNSQDFYELKKVIKKKDTYLRTIFTKYSNFKNIWFIDYLNAIKKNISCRVDRWRATEDKSRFCTTVNSSLSSMFSQVINNPKLREYYLKLLHMWKRKIFLKPVIMNIICKLPDCIKNFKDITGVRDLYNKINKTCNNYNELFATVGSTMSQGMLGKVAGVLIGLISNIINEKTLSGYLNVNWIEEIMTSYETVCNTINMLSNLTVDMCMINTSDDGAGVLITHFFQRGIQNSQIALFPKYCSTFMKWYYHLNNRFGIKISHDKSFYFLDVPIQEFNSCFFDHSYNMNKIVFNEYQQALNIEGHLSNWNDILNFIRMKTNIILELHPEGNFAYITALNYYQSFRHTLNIISSDCVISNIEDPSGKGTQSYISDWIMLNLVNPQLYGEKGFRALTLGLIDAANSLSWQNRELFISKNNFEFSILSKLFKILNLPSSYDDIFLFLIKVNSHYLQGHSTFEETKLGYVQKESVGKYYSTLRGQISLEIMLEFIMNHSRLSKTELLNQFSKAQAYSKVYSEVLSKSLFWDLMQLSSCLNQTHSLHFNHTLSPLPALIKSLSCMIEKDVIILDQNLIPCETKSYTNPYLDYQILEPLSNANKDDFKLISLDLKDLFYKLFVNMKDLILRGDKFISDADLCGIYSQLHYPRIVQLFNAINYYNKVKTTEIAISTSEVLISFNAHVRAYNLSGVINYKIADLLLKWNNMSKWFQDNLMVKFTKTHVKLPESCIKLTSVGQLISPNLNEIYPFETRELNYNLKYNFTIINQNEGKKYVTRSLRTKNKLNSLNLPMQAVVMIPGIDANINLDIEHYSSDIQEEVNFADVTIRETKPIFLFNEIVDSNDLIDIRYQCLELMTPQWNSLLKTFKYRINASILVNMNNSSVVDIIKSYIYNYPSTNNWMSGISIKTPETIIQTIRLLKNYITLGVYDVLWVKPIKGLSPIILTFNQLIDKLAALQQNDFVEYWLPVVITYDSFSLTSARIKNNTKAVYPDIITIKSSKIIKLSDLSSMSTDINETLSEAIRSQKLHDHQFQSVEDMRILYTSIPEFIDRPPIKGIIENLKSHEIQVSDLLSHHSANTASLSSNITFEFKGDENIEEPRSCNIKFQEMLPIITISLSEPYENSNLLDLDQYELNRSNLIMNYLKCQTNIKYIKDVSAIETFRNQFSCY